MGNIRFMQKDTLLMRMTNAIQHWNIFLYQFIPLGKWRSEATCTSSSRAPNLSESVLRTYLFREREGGASRGDITKSSFFSEDVNNGGNRINWQCCLQGWAQAAQCLLHLCSKAARCRAGMVCAVPMPTCGAGLEQGWKKATQRHSFTCQGPVAAGSKSQRLVQRRGCSRRGKGSPALRQHPQPFGRGHKHSDQTSVHPSSMPEPTCRPCRSVPTLSGPDLKRGEINGTFNFKRL